MTHYIGLDAHSKTCSFVVLDAMGRQVAFQEIKTGEPEILRFVDSVAGKKELVFEEGNLSKWLHAILKDKVDRLIVCDPVFVNRRLGPKDDYPDALHLAQQLRGNFLIPVFHEDGFFSELRAVVSAYLDLVKDTVRFQNRYKALFRSQAAETEGTAIYSDRERLREIKSDSNRFIAETLFDQIQFFREQKKEFLRRFKEYESTNPLIAALGSIPGIGEVRACVIAAVVLSPERFPNKYKFWAYCMFVKYECRSGGVSYGKKNTRGNRVLKNVFMGAAKTVLAGNGSFRKYYDGLREKGVDHAAAKKNVARKIAAIALASMRKGTRYKENYESERKARTANSDLKHSVVEC